MFVYRSFALGLLGACCLLLAMRPPTSVVPTCPGQVAIVSAHGARQRGPCCDDTTTSSSPILVDVAAGITSSQLAQLILLQPGEQIASIDDASVGPGLDAGLRLASIDLRSQRYIDLSVTGPRGMRRMLVLLH